MQARARADMCMPAQVFKAVRGGVQVVAVKVLHDMGEEQSSNFGHEIAVLKSCRHPNIVQFQVLTDAASLLAAVL